MTLDDENVSDKNGRARAGRLVHAFGDDALGFGSAVDIAELIRTGQISPAEATEAAINRAEAVEPQIRAFAFEGFAGPRDRARSVDPSAAVFAGVPTVVKDNVDVRGMPTNYGTQAFEARPASADGNITRQYRALGVTILGKSKLPEFGFNASTEFREWEATRNPWNTAVSAGASSGGSAALVAAGVVPIAHANDGGGSIRIPAAACGLVGLKPSRGRLRAERLSQALPVRIVTEGVLTRSVRDTAHFYAGAEKVYRNSRLPRIGLVAGAGPRRVRVGTILDSVTGSGTDADTRAAVVGAADLLSDLGHDVSEMPVPIPASFADDFLIYWAMLSFLLTTVGKRALSAQFDASKLDGLTIGLKDLYVKKVQRTPGVLMRLRRTARLSAAIFDTYDVVLSPVVGHTTPDLGYLSPNQPFDQLIDRLQHYAVFTPLNNVSGGPAISIPFGRTARGLPIGIHISAALGSERTLLELAYEIEEASGWLPIYAVAQPN